MRRKRALALAALFVAAGCREHLRLPTDTPPRTFDPSRVQLFGVVYQTNDQCLEGAAVTVILADRVLTPSQNHCGSTSYGYVVEGVPGSSNATVRVSAPGYRTVEEQRFIVGDRDFGSLRADFVLQREEAAQ